MRGYGMLKIAFTTLAIIALQTTVSVADDASTQIEVKVVKVSPAEEERSEVQFSVENKSNSDVCIPYAGGKIPVGIFLFRDNDGAALSPFHDPWPNVSTFRSEFIRLPPGELVVSIVEFSILDFPGIMRSAGERPKPLDYSRDDFSFQVLATSARCPKISIFNRVKFEPGGERGILSERTNVVIQR